jgi:ABC-type multidrug transport system fused ATPase/permease subunit
MVSVQRCFKLYDIPQEKTLTEEEDKMFKYQHAKWPQHGEVEYKNVSLRYRPNTEIVLKKLTFKVEPKMKIGVVGRTGAGKSTVCLSLSRIVETVEGSILIDGIDIKDVDLLYLRSKVTVIPQDPTLFNDTLRFNIDPEGLSDDTRIIDLLTKAGLTSLL